MRTIREVFGDRYVGLRLKAILKKQLFVGFVGSTQPGLGKHRGRACTFNKEIFFLFF
jgi:hypothetical protein